MTNGEMNDEMNEEEIPLDPATRDFLRRNGRKGGRAGTGDAKRRPHDFYLQLVKIREAKRLARKMAAPTGDDLQSENRPTPTTQSSENLST